MAKTKIINPHFVVELKQYSRFNEEGVKVQNGDYYMLISTLKGNAVISEIKQFSQDLGTLISGKETHLVRPSYQLEIKKRIVFDPNGGKSTEGKPYLLISTPRYSAVVDSTNLKDFAQAVIELRKISG